MLSFLLMIHDPSTLNWKWDHLHNIPFRAALQWMKLPHARLHDHASNMYDSWSTIPGCLPLLKSLGKRLCLPQISFEGGWGP